MVTQTSDPLVRAGTPETNMGRPSSGQKYTSSLGQGLWQRTNRAVSAGISTACNSRGRLTGGVGVWAALRCMVCGSGWAGVAVPRVTSIWTRKGRIMSIPISTGGDSRPMMTMKLALPLALPHCRFRCCVFPAIWRGFPCTLWMTPSKGFKGPHWMWYCHQTENPIQVTEAPVSTRPRTGMPSRLSWSVMGGLTAHPTGVTLASGDPYNRFNCTLGPGWESSLAVGSSRICPRGRSWALARACCRRRRWRTGRAGQLAAKCPSSPQRKQCGGRRSVRRRGRWGKFISSP